MKLKCVVIEVEHVDVYQGRVVYDATIKLRVINQHVTPELTTELKKLCESINYIEIDTDDFTKGGI